MRGASRLSKRQFDEILVRMASHSAGRRRPRLGLFAPAVGLLAFAAFVELIQPGTQKGGTAAVAPPQSHAVRATLQNATSGGPADKPHGSALITASAEPAKRASRPQSPDRYTSLAPRRSERNSRRPTFAAAAGRQHKPLVLFAPPANAEPFHVLVASDTGVTHHNSPEFIRGTAPDIELDNLVSGSEPLDDSGTGTAVSFDTAAESRPEP